MFPLNVFTSESEAAGLLRTIRWDDGVVCPRCRSDCTVKNGSYRKYQRYLCKDCDRTFNDKTGTIFAFSKIPLRMWFFIIYAHTRFGVTIHQLAFELPVSYRAIRRAVERYCRALDCRLPELGKTVEIDEVYVTAGMKGRERDTSRSRGHQSRGRGTYDSDQPPIIIIADRDSGDTYTIPACNADQATIKLILGVHDNAEDETITVCTDEFRSYNFLDEDDRFVHKTVTHSDGEYAAEDGTVHVNTCESQGSLLRPWLLRRRGLAKDKLTLHLRVFDLSRQIHGLPGREALKTAVSKAL